MTLGLALVTAISALPYYYWSAKEESEQPLVDLHGCTDTG